MPFVFRMVKSAPVNLALPDSLEMLPRNLALQSASPVEVVLPYPQVIEALDVCVRAGRRALGWEAWLRTPDGAISHGDAPMGSADLSALNDLQAAECDVGPLRRLILLGAFRSSTQAPTYCSALRRLPFAGLKDGIASLTVGGTANVRYRIRVRGERYRVTATRLLALTIAAIALVFSVHAFGQAATPLEWPTAPGRITESRLGKVFVGIHIGRYENWPMFVSRFFVKYQYVVGAETYEGTRIMPTVIPADDIL